MGIEAAGEHLKGILKKSQGTEFCHLLRCLATDEKYYARFSEPVPPEIDSIDIPDRLNELQSPTKRKVVRPVVTAAPPKPAASKPAPATKTAVASPKAPVTSPKKSDKNAKAAVPAKAEKIVRKESPAPPGTAAKDKRKIAVKETDSAGKKAAPAKARTASNPPKAAARGNDRKKK
jgi:cytoskeleton-associated protein 5